MPLAAGEQGARDTQDGAAADSEVDADADASAEPYQVAAAGRGQRRGKPVAKPLAPEQIAQLEQHLKHPNVQAFLSLIANAEGATYDSRYGDRPGGKRNAFPDYSQYPVTDEKGMPAKGPAGRYQIAPETYGDLRQKLGLDDFSPHTQDLMAAQLLVEQGAMPHLLAGNFDAALSGAAPKWRSLARGPGLSNVTPPQQPYVPYERLRPLFDLYRAP
ncbi:MAG: hypothetical protein HY060_04435 [Proteobacteria bacterium]|nr:hypothetical protein [Pseudomonadota bacterium]